MVMKCHTKSTIPPTALPGIWQRIFFIVSTKTFHFTPTANSSTLPAPQAAGSPPWSSCRTEYLPM
jgi:hypothetical protein